MKKFVSFLITNILMAIIVYFPDKYRKMLHDYMYAFDLQYRDKIIVALKLMICFGLVVSQAEISAQVKEICAEYSYKSSTAIEDRFAGLGLKERGVSLEELCDKYNFLGTSYKSLCY